MTDQRLHGHPRLGHQYEVERLLISHTQTVIQGPA